MIGDVRGFVQRFGGIKKGPRTPDGMMEGGRSGIVRKYYETSGDYHSALGVACKPGSMWE